MRKQSIRVGVQWLCVISVAHFMLIAGQAWAQSETSGTTAPTTRSDKPGERPDVPLIVGQGGVLLKRGQVVIEPSVEFSLVETNRAEVAGFTVLPAILIGSFDISQVARETITTAMTMRAGVTERFEIEVRVPFLYRSDRETRRPIGSGASADETVDIDGYGLGDVEFAVHFQMNDGTGGWPFFVANVRTKSNSGTSPFDVDTDAAGDPSSLPTGTGFWSIQPSVTMIMRSDPAVVFSNINYTLNIPRAVSGFGDIDPGDSFGGSLGIGFALNEKLSLSTAYDHSFVLETTQNGNSTNDTLHIGRMLFGGSYRMSDRVSINLSFGLGVTEQAPDISTGLRVPISFQLTD